jgi:hypothetical protein
MLADTSISRADVSKAKPQRGLAGHRGTRTPAGGHTGGLASLSVVSITVPSPVSSCLNLK